MGGIGGGLGVGGGRGVGGGGLGGGDGEGGERGSLGLEEEGARGLGDGGSTAKTPEVAIERIRRTKILCNS